jgi:hypothetical protein
VARADASIVPGRLARAAQPAPDGPTILERRGAWPRTSSRRTRAATTNRKARVVVGLLAFDRSRLDSLRIGLSATLDELRRIRSDDVAAVDAMRIVSGACRALGDVWLPRVQDILNSTAMTSCRRSAVGSIDVAQAARYATTRADGWEVAADPLTVYGPQVPGTRSFGEVLADVRSGALVPMADPLDANGRAGAHYTSLTFAPAVQHRVGTEDLTSNTAKVLDFFSDGLPIGWREHQSLTIYYLSNARVTSSVHVLSAYDRDNGPETVLDLTTEATVSGYMIVEEDSSEAELNVRVGPGDDTQSYPITSQSISTYSGMFYPDEPVEFQPMTHEDRFVNPDRWTFTKSSAPMVDGWGTWEL